MKSRVPYLLVGLFIASFLAGCASLDSGGQRVRLVSQEYVEKKNCKFVAAVSNSIDFFADDWVVNLRNRAAEKGGNALVLQTSKDYGISKTGSGESYLCPNG